MATYRTLLNGEREAYFASRYTTNKITPTIPTDPVADTMLRTPWTYPYTEAEKAELQSRTSQIQVCPPTCPAGYSAPGKLLPGWIQPNCIRAPCPAMYVGDKGDLITEIFEMPAQNGTTVVVATDDEGEVIGAVEKKPNWLPLALAAGAAYFFMM